MQGKLARFRLLFRAATPTHDSQICRKFCTKKRIGRESEKKCNTELSNKQASVSAIIDMDLDVKEKSLEQIHYYMLQCEV